MDYRFTVQSGRRSYSETVPSEELSDYSSENLRSVVATAITIGRLNGHAVYGMWECLVQSEDRPNFLSESLPGDVMISWLALPDLRTEDQ